MDRFEHRRARSSRVQVCRCSETDAAADGTAQVGQYVAEQVVGNDHVVLLRRLHEVNACGIDMVVVGVNVRVFLSNLVKGALPEVSAEVQDVGLVAERQMLAFGSAGQIKGVTDSPLDTHTSVDRTLGCDLKWGVLPQDAAFTGIRALSILADHRHVDAIFGGDKRALVDVEVQLEPHLKKQASLDHTWWNARRANGANVNGIKAAPFLERRVAQDLAVAQITSAAEVIVDSLKLDASSGNYLKTFGNYLRADPVATHDHNWRETLDGIGWVLWWLMADPKQLSQQAHDRLQAELEDLTTRGRIDIARKIETARELGDLSENGDYHAAKEEQGKMEGRVMHLEGTLEDCIIVEVAAATDTVAMGNIVEIRYDGDTGTERYLVGSIEERREGVTVMSSSSPLGAALIGAKIGQAVSYESPGGTLAVEIVAIEV